MFDTFLVRELESLQTNVPTLPFSIMKSEMKEGLGPELFELLTEIDPLPIGSGAIAQVRFFDLFKFFF